MHASKQTAMNQDCCGDRAQLATYFHRIRKDSELLCAPLELEDYSIQTMPEVSPPKWHLAHTSWFFETMLLKPYLADYREYNAKFSELFNSYYDTIGAYHPRMQRGLLSRPTVKQVYRYRAHVDEHINTLLSQANHPQWPEITRRMIIGVNHEQQHQELMLTDIKHIFAYNPLRPEYRELQPAQGSAVKLNWVRFAGGLHSIGFDGEGFAYDNEGPRHKVYLNDYYLASRPVTNAEFMEFIDDGGYQQPDYWLSDAWQKILQQHWQAPLYWEQRDGQWWYMTLSGMQPVNKHAPVCHVSYYEAAAYARWAGARLPNEAEWENAATELPAMGNFREKDWLQPAPPTTDSENLLQMFGDVWELTQSPYTPYPGYNAEAGPLGEYNGKFMSSQMVLRGGSCVTPLDHIRPTYRNFFYPAERWQFSGFRLAKDV
ncbi:MAG: ergothioneine biosynthesis protein EgtB [Gammaproteobacteria bacterium]|jgi:ergothioneine biosynthesis protein EgtB|nr:ergothioneine biosynthesis protein EgtB [Gammaproteobacteria bacterium]